MPPLHKQRPLGSVIYQHFTFTCRVCFIGWINSVKECSVLVFNLQVIPWHLFVQPELVKFNISTTRFHWAVVLFAKETSWHFCDAIKQYLWKECRNSIWMTCHYPDFRSTSLCLRQFPTRHKKSETQPR